MKIGILLLCGSAVVAYGSDVKASRDSLENAEKTLLLEDLQEPQAEESVPQAVVVPSLDTDAGKEYLVEDAEIEKLPELPFDIDAIPQSKNPEDPCRKIRDLTNQWRELGREIAQKTAELVRVRGDERQKIREQIRKIREEMTKTNAAIRENTRECARTRRPTLRPPTPEA
ncbi:uncharacterized protein LOC100897302 [Galendromus occidentalis]|uniref:Uncharacterized protein LOC100897302 n=1 Tax=Galendromus occidentalis TaxID=34638 RepID=A0AAJ6QT34_9ACAR|nr:uncharacterized protein LOC100897302 [Galendromus occidentalis]